jgi:hypothetical protein
MIEMHKRDRTSKQRARVMEYYDLKKNWRKVKRHINDERVQKILVRDFNRFTIGRWRQEFKAGQLPTEFESCDWWCEHQGKIPAYWNYVKHAACHWLVNFALTLAQLVEPHRPWRIITSPKHSTVWDGHELLFDFNFSAMGVPADECFELANKRELKPGKLVRVHIAKPFSAEKEMDRPVTMNDLVDAIREEIGKCPAKSDLACKLASTRKWRITKQSKDAGANRAGVQ